MPLLVNMQPAGKYLGEEFHRAGGVPAVVNELMKRKLIHEKALTVNGKTMGENCAERHSDDPDVIMPIDKPLKEERRLRRALSGNLFDDAIMKTSVIDDEFRTRFLSNPKDPDAFEGRAIVFEGPEDYHHRIDDPKLKIDEHSILFIRGTGPIGYPGGAEVVNMQPPAALHQERRARAALRRRRPAIGHLRLAVDPQRFARGGGGRGIGAAQDRRPRAHRSQEARRQHPHL